MGLLPDLTCVMSVGTLFLVVIIITTGFLMNRPISKVMFNIMMFMLHKIIFLLSDVLHFVPYNVINLKTLENSLFAIV